MKKNFTFFDTLAFVLALGVIFIGCTPVTDNGGGKGGSGNPPPPPATTTYTITYDGNGSDTGAVPVDSTKYTSGQQATVLGNTETLIKTGNEFVGWNTAAGGTGTTYYPGASITVTANITLYARWTATGTAYTITYDGNTEDSGSVPVDTNKYIAGDEVPVSGNSGSLVKALYTFMGWNTQADGLGNTYPAGNSITVGSSDITLYAKWSLATALHVTYNKNYNLASGNVPFDDTDYAPNATVTVLGNTGSLVRTGYKFDGWNTTASGNGITYQPADTFTITANTMLYAKWTQIFTVTYNGNSNTGGVVPVDANSPYTSGATVTVLGNTGTLVRTGYRFDGWNTSSGGFGTNYTGGQPFTITSNTTLYAKWTPVYTLTYNGHGNDSGTVPIDSTQYTSGQAATVRDNTGSLTYAGKIFNGWNTNSLGTGKWYWPGDTITMTYNTTLFAVWEDSAGRLFNASRVTDNSWYSLRAKRLAVSAHCIVYADVTQTGITTATGEAIAAKYESAIYSQITGAFGGIEDVDKNGRVIFLLLDIIDGYVSSGGYVAGYFQPYHMYARSAGAPYSNEADMLFMDVNPQTPGSQGFYSTMAHELQHLIEFSETVSKGNNEKDLWINEGLSTGAEYIYGNGSGSPAQQTSRIDYFNASGTSIPYGNNFFVWNGYWEQPENGGDVLADYATAYLFFQWLQIHASNNTGIYKEIIASTYADYRAVTSLAFSRISTLSTSGNLATDWGTLLGNWLLANAINNSTGLLGYQNQITTTTYFFPGSYTSWAFSPGEGIFSPITSGSVSTTGFSSGSHIQYIGIGASLDTTGPQYDGTALLTFNANSNKDEADENGKLAANIVGGPQSSIQTMQMSLNGNVAPTPSAPLPTSYPIDVHFRPDGTLSPDSPRVGISRPVLKGVPINKN